jgi:uncharacterized protein (TIGR00255 family)
MVNSMTGFAALKGNIDVAGWAWEVRSVNARGLDLRLRLPEGLDDLEAVVRKAFSAALSRGNVSINLRLFTEGGTGRMALDDGQLAVVLEALKNVENRAGDTGLHLTASTAADILALRGVMEMRDNRDDIQKDLVNAMKAQVDEILASFVAARGSEGAALVAILTEQLGRVRGLVEEATIAARTRQAQVAENLQANIAAVLDNSEGVDEARLAQELAILAVKADVTEEIDRLRAHIDAADELLVAKGAVGRKFDFLMQEFNREANTLCSKSGSTELTSVGLDLKTVIDQMREQVQNVE